MSIWRAIVAWFQRIIGGPKNPKPHPKDPPPPDPEPPPAPEPEPVRVMFGNDVVQYGGEDVTYGVSEP